MIKLFDLLVEVSNANFFNDKIALNFPTVVAKDIKLSFDSIEVWKFTWSADNFENIGKTYKKYKDGLGKYSVIAISKSNFDKVISDTKNPKMQDRIRTFVQQKPWDEILQSGLFLKFLIDTNSIDKYKTTADKVINREFDSEEITKNTWNTLKQLEFGKIKVEGAYYHVSVNNKLKPGDIIKPYFNSEEYVKKAISSNPFDRTSADTFRLIEDVLEKLRPSEAPSRDKTSYIFKTIDDAVEYLHGGDRSIYAIKPLGKVYFVDMNWIDKMNVEINDYVDIIDYEDDEELIDEAHKEMMKNINEMGKYYWSQKSTDEIDTDYGPEPVWEGLTKENIEVIKQVR
jgi:hypothetical protein